MTLFTAYSIVGTKCLMPEGEEKIWRQFAGRGIYCMLRHVFSLRHYGFMLIIIHPLNADGQVNPRETKFSGIEPRLMTHLRVDAKPMSY